MGTGYGSGEGRAKEAAEAAISSPLLEDVSISGAKGVLINITGGKDLGLHDVNAASIMIQKAVGDDANIIFGAVIDPSLKDQVRVTVIATGFGSEIKTVEKETNRVEEKDIHEALLETKPGKVMELFPEHSEEDYPVRKVSSGNNGSGYRTPSFQNEKSKIPAYMRRIEKS